MNPQWLAGIGTFVVLGLGWFTCATGGWIAGQAAGRRVGAETDGCLLSFGNTVLALVGGGLGLLIAPYPTFLITSVVTSALFPTVMTLFFLRRNLPRTG